LGIAPEDEALLSRGWPHLAVLVDGHEDDGKPADSAWKVLDAIDPVYGPRWPRETARRYLHGLAVGGAARTRASYEEGLASTAPVTVEVADRIIAQTVRSIDRYPFHLQQALFLLECHLGPEVLGDRIAAALEGFGKRDWRYGNLHARIVQTVFSLECCLLRSERSAAEALFERVRRAWEARPPDEGYPSAALRLRLTLEGSQGAETHWYGVYNMPFLTVDEALARHRLEHEYVGWLVDPQYLRCFGPDIVPPRAFEGLRRNPAWKQQIDVEVYGVIRHPVAVRWMVAMLGSRAARGLPEGWLLAHMDLARPILEKLARLPSPHSAIIEALLAGDAAAVRKARSAKPPSAGQVRKEVKGIFDALYKALKAGRGQADVERDAITTAVHGLIEVKAATGDPLPEAHIGHALGVDGWGKFEAPLQRLDATEEELTRWFDLIDAAS